MNDLELERLLKDSDRVERKASLSGSDRIREAICAFANDLPEHSKPGVIFIGVNDDGSCAGLQITDELLRKLADMRDDGNKWGMHLTAPTPRSCIFENARHGRL